MIAVQAQAGPERRRRRPPVSCILCRKRKIKCNRESPCSNCAKSRNVTCVYEDHGPLRPRRPEEDLGLSRTLDLNHVQEPQYQPAVFPTDKGVASTTSPQVPSHASRSLPSSSKRSWTLNSQTSPSEVESMKSRIRQLEEQLFKVVQQQGTSPTENQNSNSKTMTSQIAGVFHVNHEDRLLGKSHAVSRSVMHKTRLFGQSHWAHAATLFGDMFEMIEPHLREENSKVTSYLRRCKELARTIKSQRNPKWPTPPTPDLPPKDVADELVDNYLRTIEPLHRILHIPSFRIDYDALWVSESRPSTAFLVQLKLILAIGTITYDEGFSMRASAVRWVYEAQTWVSDPDFKSRLNIQSLQTNILLLIAREIANVGGEETWITAGSVLRTALYMGLHRDPSRLPLRATYAAEMRRRLWNTILELTLQSSMLSGGPPLIDITDFDTEPPGNYDDDQLLAEDPVPKPADSFTQTSVAIVLRKTFPQRLGILRLLNNFGSYSTYEQTLEHDAELRKSYKLICRMLREYSSGTGPSPSQFQIRMVDFVIHSYMSTLHQPFFRPALSEAQYAFSRKVVIESSLKIWCTVYPTSPIMAANPTRDIPISDHDDFSRLAASGNSFFRTVSILASLYVAAELRAQLQDEESLAPSPCRLDFLSLLSDTKSRSWKSVEAGDTNVKGYLLSSLILAQIEGLMQGVEKEEFPKLLVKTAEEAEERCLSLFEEIVGQGYNEENADVIHQMPIIPTPTTHLGDWEFIMSDAFFNAGNTEPMNWVFTDGGGFGPFV